MNRENAPRLQGTLDLILLRTLITGPSHGRVTVKHIQRTIGELLQIGTGFLYPASHGPDSKRRIAASWAISGKGKRARYYRLAPLRGKQLAAEEPMWLCFSRAMAMILTRTNQEAR